MLTVADLLTLIEEQKQKLFGQLVEYFLNPSARKIHLSKNRTWWFFKRLIIMFLEVFPGV